MPLIKSANTPAAAKAFSMTDIEAHARAMLLRANQQAEQLLVAAQAEADAIREQAKAEGLAIGKRDGVAQGKAEGAAAGKKEAFEAEKAKLAEAFTQLVTMQEAFDAERHRVIAQAEAEVMPLAIAIARKLTRRLGEVDPMVVESNLREAIRLMNGPHDLQVFIHPDQHVLVGQILPRLGQEWPQIKKVQIVTDPTIAKGGCRVTTAGGEIDADLNNQLDRLIEELVGVVS
jgi:flagellar assembly protein FliH